MKLLSKLIRKRFYLFAATFVIGILSLLVTLGWNDLLSAIITGLGNHMTISSKHITPAVILLFLNALLQGLMTYLSGYTCEYMSHDLRMGYAAYFLSLKHQELCSHQTGKLPSSLQNEITEISDYLNGNFFPLLNHIIKFTGTFLWFLFLCPTLAVLTTLPSFLIMIYVAKSSKIISSCTSKTQDAKAAMNGLTDTLISVFPIITIFDAAPFLKNRFHHSVCEWESASIREEKTKARLMSFSAMLTNIPLMLIVLLGGKMVIQKAISLGTLYVFINLSANISGFLMNMPGIIAGFRRFLINMERICKNCLLI